MRILFTISFLGTLSLSVAQESYVFPEDFSSYTMNYGWENPAYVDEQAGVKLLGQFKLRTGAFKKVNTYFFTGELTRNNERVDAFRVMVMNENEGPYISRPRFYGNYATTIPLTEETSLGFGATFGVAGVYYAATGATSAGSGIRPDGSLALNYYWTNGFLGVGGHQLFNAGLDPLDSEVLLSRYYSFLMHQKHSLNQDWDLEGDILVNIRSNSFSRYDFQLKGTYQDYFSLGGLFRFKQHLSLFGQFKIIGGQNDFLFAFFYNLPAFQSADAQVVSYELSLAFLIK